MSDEKMKFTDLTLEERTEIIEKAKQKNHTELSPIIDEIVKQLDFDKITSGECRKWRCRIDLCDYGFHFVASHIKFVLDELKTRIKPIKITHAKLGETSFFFRKNYCIVYLDIVW